MNKKSLERELYLAGASGEDMPSLLRAAESLSVVSAPFATSRRKSGFQNARFLVSLFIGAMVLVLSGSVLSTVARQSLPGDLLYAYKRLNEKIATKIEPELRPVVMMRRSDEVHNLVLQGASQDVVLASVDAYVDELERAHREAGKTQEYERAKEYAILALSRARAESRGRVRHSIERAIVENKEY